jgi:hypothetical protein
MPTRNPNPNNPTPAARLVQDSAGNVTGLDTHAFTDNIPQPEPPVVVSISHLLHQIVVRFAPGTSHDEINGTSKAIHDAASGVSSGHK